MVGTGIGLLSGFIDTLADLEILECQSRSEYLVIVDGTDDEVLRAESILSNSKSSKVWFAKPVLRCAEIKMAISIKLVLRGSYGHWRTPDMSTSLVAANNNNDLGLKKIKEDAQPKPTAVEIAS